jgi:hypothetical protein
LCQRELTVDAVVFGGFDGADMFRTGDEIGRALG